MTKECFECGTNPRYEDKLYCSECLDKPKREFLGGSAGLVIYDKI